MNDNAIFSLVLSSKVSSFRVHEYLRSLPLEQLVKELYASQLISKDCEEWRSHILSEAQEGLARLINVRNRTSEAFLLRNVSQQEYFAGMQRVAKGYNDMKKNTALDGRQKIILAKKLHAELISYATSDVVFDDNNAPNAQKVFNLINRRLTEYIANRKFQAYRLKEES